MKKLFIILLFVPLISYGQWSHEPLNVSFVNHSLSCMMISFCSTLVLDNLFPDSRFTPMVGFALGLAAGMLYEFLETTPDELDLVADFLGAGVGVGIAITIPYLKKR